MSLGNEVISEKKQKKFLRTNLALTLLLVLTALAVYWFEFKNVAKENVSEYLLPVTQDKIPQSLKIQNVAKQLNIQMSCKENCKLGDPNAKWEITTPILFSGEAGNIGAFISTLKTTHPQETLLFKDSNIESRLSDFGLATDSAKRKFQNSAEILFQGDSNPYKIYFGDTTAVGEDRYVLVEGPGLKVDRLYILTGHVYRSLTQELNHWRNKRIFEFAASEVEAVHLVNAELNSTIDLERRGADWFFKKPLLTDNRVDEEAIDALLSGTVFLNALGYVSDNKQKDATTFKITGNPKYVVQLKLKNKKDLQLNIFEVLEKKTKDSNIAPKFYVTVNDKSYIAEIDIANLNKFKKDVNHFRYKNLISQSEKNNISKFEFISKDKKKAVFTKDGAVWKLIEGKIENLDIEKAQAGINKLATTRVTEFIKANTVPGGNPLESHWNFYDVAGKKLFELESYVAATGTKRYFKLTNKEIGQAQKEGDFPDSIQYFQAKK